MAVKNLENPMFHVDEPATGAPLAGGKVYVYQAGTTNALTVYKEQSLTNAWTQPVVLDSNGDAKIWFDQDAKVVVHDSEDSLVYSFDNISPTGGVSTISGDFNLVQNGGFESSDSGGAPSSWTVTKNDSSVPVTVQTTSNVTQGKSSLFVDGQSGFGGAALTSSKFDVTSNKYLLTRFDYAVSAATATMLVQVFWYQKDDTASAVTASTDLLNASSGHPSSMTTKGYSSQVPSDATRAEIKITAIDAGGTDLDADAYFDNVFCQESVDILRAPNGIYTDSGISFDSGTNTLSNYETGTWTPSLLDDDLNTEDGNYTTREGHYTRIGDMCFITGYIDVSSRGTLNTGHTARIGNLPITSSSSVTNQAGGISVDSGSNLVINGGDSLNGVIVASSDIISLRRWSQATGTVTPNLSILFNGSTDDPVLRFHGWYKV